MIVIELSQRKLKILSAIVESYIENGEPVSSKNLCDTLNLGLSSATLRNEMAELTELGHLEQPHVSAGRIPSYKGYRLYIDKLMCKKAVPKQTRRLITKTLEMSIGSPENLVKTAAMILADITKCAVISTISSSENTKINAIDIIKTGKNTAIIVAVMSTGIVNNKLFRCSFEITSEVLKLFRLILNKYFLGAAVSDVNLISIQKIILSLKELSLFTVDVLLAFLELCTEASKSRIQLEGQTNLLFLPDFDSYKALQVINYLKHTSYIEKLFLKAHENRNALIGKESNYEELISSSIIIKNYHVNGKEYGSIGLVGSMRMDYSSLISYLDFLTSTMEDLLNDILNFN